MADMSSKKEYKELFKTIRLIFIGKDPMGFISGGSPQDEYDTEVSKILPALKDCKSVHDIQNVIIRVFEEQFDVKAISGFNDIANEIYQIYYGKNP